MNQPIFSAEAIAKKGDDLTFQGSITANFITTYNDSHAAIRHILQRSWLLLPNDPILQDFVTEKPKITFKRQKSPQYKEYVGLKLAKTTHLEHQWKQQERKERQFQMRSSTLPFL